MQLYYYYIVNIINMLYIYIISTDYSCLTQCLTHFVFEKHYSLIIKWLIQKYLNDNRFNTNNVNSYIIVYQTCIKNIILVGYIKKTLTVMIYMK